MLTSVRHLATAIKKVRGVPNKKQARDDALACSYAKCLVVEQLLPDGVQSSLCTVCQV